MSFHSPIHEIPLSVVVDRKNDPKADTGGFDLIYKQVIPPSPAYMGLNLALKGQQITQRSGYSSTGGGGVKKDKLNKEDSSNNNRNNLKQFVSRNISSGTVVGHGYEKKQQQQRKGPVIMDLINCLDVKQQIAGRVGGPAAVVRNSQGYLKSRSKGEHAEKNNNSSSARRHHSCGPVLRQQSTMKSNTPRVEDGSGVAVAGVEEPFIVPLVQPQQQQVAQGDLNYLRSLGNRVDQRGDVNISLPTVMNTCRKLSSESIRMRVKTSPKGKV